MRRILLIIGLILTGVLFSFGITLAQTGVTVLTLADLRLRTGPGTQFDVIATIPVNTTLAASARTAAGDWVRVDFKGQVGWVYAAQLRIKGNFFSLPVGNAQSTAVPGGPEVTPTPTPPPNGSVESLTPYASTDRVVYYRLVYWSDGLRVTGYFAEPKGFDKHPAVIYNRGGNRNVGALDGTELAPFAEVGFVAVATQYRGVLGGEGQEEFGGADVHDVLNLLPFLKSRSSVDPERIAIFGSSRGGMMTYLALKAQAQNGSHDLKVAVTVSGVADLFMWDSEHPELTRPLFSALIGSTPRTNAGPFIQRSATYWPGLIRVPLLIQHGEADSIVSIKESRKLYAALRSVGANVKLITYPGDQHGLPDHAGGIPEGLKWFQKYIGRPGENFDFYEHQDAIYHAFVVLRGH
jgi:dipeptidyl aminopeptidase/acylaminoacyl peptidase